MGKFITIPTKNIRPSQDFLKEKTLQYILDCIQTGKLDKLPPTPIVRPSNLNDEYICIDGHNLIAVYDYLGKPCEVYIAISPEDKLPHGPMVSEAIDTRNRDLLNKYEFAADEALRISSSGINSFSNLRQKYEVIADKMKSYERP